jgi:hypothetical protein
MADQKQDRVKLVTPKEPSITKPGSFCLDDFKSEHAPAHAGVETLQTALPIISQGCKDFVRLHRTRQHGRRNCVSSACQSRA